MVKEGGKEREQPPFRASGGKKRGEKGLSSLSTTAGGKGKKTSLPFANGRGKKEGPL